MNTSYSARTVDHLGIGPAVDGDADYNGAWTAQAGMRKPWWSGEKLQGGRLETQTKHPLFGRDG